MAENSIPYTLPRLINETVPLILDKILTHSFQGFTLYVKQFFIKMTWFSHRMKCSNIILIIECKTTYISSCWILVSTYDFIIYLFSMLDLFFYLKI